IAATRTLRDVRGLDKAPAYAESLIENAPDPVFVSDLEGKILQANDAVSELLGFRADEVIEQSLSRFISPEETREFTAALREVVAKGVTRDARLNPRSASGDAIPTTLNASALRDSEGRVIGAIGILRDLHPETFDVEAMVRDVVTTIQPLAQKNANALEVHCPPGVGVMHADLTKVRQSLFNLLSNACKFTEGGSVRLEVGRDDPGGWLT